MEKNHENIEDVLVDEKFLAWYFKTGKEAAQQWQEMLASDLQLQSLNNEVVFIMKQLHIDEKEISKKNIEKAYRKLKEKMLEADQAPVLNMPAPRRRWWLAAASVILLTGAFFLWRSVSGTNEIHKTEFGQISEQSLPDGSQMVLNANSTVTLGNDWSKGKDRELWLKGEAFFTVKKTDSKQKFIVHTSKFDIIVTGTQFNVVDRPDRVNIMLKEGSVILKTKDGKNIFMKPGDFMEYKEEQFNKKEVASVNVLVWTERKLNFDNTPLDEAATMIKEIYGVEIIAGDDKIKSKTLTGIMPNDDLDVLLQAIEASLDCKAEIKDNQVLLRTNQ